MERCGCLEAPLHGHRFQPPGSSGRIELRTQRPSAFTAQEHHSGEDLLLALTAVVNFPLGDDFTPP